MKPVAKKKAAPKKEKKEPINVVVSEVPVDKLTLAAALKFLRRLERCSSSPFAGSPTVHGPQRIELKATINTMAEAVKRDGVALKSTPAARGLDPFTDDLL